MSVAGPRALPWPGFLNAGHKLGSPPGLTGLTGESAHFQAGVRPIHITHIGGLERGVRNPSYATLFKLAKALRVKPGELVVLADDSSGRPR